MANRYEHVGKLKTNTEEHREVHRLLSREQAEGTTSVTIGAVTYYVVVKNEVQKVELKVGEKFLAPGKLMQQEKRSGDCFSCSKWRSASICEKYRDRIRKKEYLIGQSSYVLVNSEVLHQEHRQDLQ